MAPLSPHSLWVVGPHIALRKGNTAVLPSASRVSSHPSHFLPCHQLAQAFSFFLNVFFFFAATPTTTQAEGQIEATAASLHHSHSSAGPQASLQSIPQLKAMLDP